MIAALTLRAALLGVLWWILAEGNTDAWWLGAIGVGLSLATSVVLVPPNPAVAPLGAVLGFVAFFIRQSSRGALQVALTALRPRLDIRPAVVELRLELTPQAARCLMTLVLGLMPGTVGIQLEGDRLRVHVLDDRLPVVAEAMAMQERIARLFPVSE